MARTSCTILLAWLLLISSAAHIQGQDANPTDDTEAEAAVVDSDPSPFTGIMPLPDKRTLPIRLMMERCKSQRYLRYPVEKDCKPKDCPKLKNEAKSLPASKTLGCKPERIPNISILITRPQNATNVGNLFQQVPKTWTPEYIAFQDGYQLGNKAASNNHKTLVRILANDYVIYSSNFLGVARPLNRMVKFADAETVVVVDGDHIHMLTEQWLKSAVRALRVHENLGIIGMRGFDGMANPGEMEFMEAVSLTGPIMMRRSAFLGVGLIDTSNTCPGEAAKEKASWFELCMSMWKHGLAVAALDWEAKPNAATKAKIPRALASKAVTNKCAQSTQEIARGNPSCPHGTDVPYTGIATQYFKRGKNIKGLGKALRTAEPVGGDLLVNDDSQSEHDQWMGIMRGAQNFFLIHSPNLHEIRGYNKMGKLSNARYIGFIQDDDNPMEKDWMQRGTDLFESYSPTLALVGGRAGRLDTGKTFEIKGQRKSIPGYTPGPLFQNDGPKYGIKYTRLNTMDPRTGIPFLFVYKVNASPLIATRSVFLDTGMYHPGFSCKGESGISFDFEYSVRMWKHNYQVGLYYSYFRDFENSRSSGTWASAARTKKRMVTWRRNNLQLYYMYPGFHHKVGTALPVKLNKDKVKKLSCGKRSMKNGRCPGFETGPRKKTSEKSG